MQHFLINAMKDSTNKGNSNLENEKFKLSIIDSLKETDLAGVTGHIKFNEFNNPEKEVVIIKITNGKESFWGKY